MHLKRKIYIEILRLNQILFPFLLDPCVLSFSGTYPVPFLFAQQESKRLLNFSSHVVIANQPEDLLKRMFQCRGECCDLEKRNVHY